jgi:hypothetical protein
MTISTSKKPPLDKTLVSFKSIGTMLWHALFTTATITHAIHANALKRQ